MTVYSLSINGKSIGVEVDGTTPLLWVLRDWLTMTGTKFGCGIGLCGCCTVHIDGEAIRSCQLAVSDVGEARITTIEGLANGPLSHVQSAWIAEQVPQCGYCQSGMIMAAAALLSKKPFPTDEDISNNITNICRCGTYKRVRAAIHRAASERAEQPAAE